MSTNIIGQKQLLSKLDQFTLKSFPHSVILNGKVGSGKHLISQYIVEKFDCDFVNVDNGVDVQDVITNTIQDASIKFYLIEANFLSEKNQNALLKLAEDPISNAYLIIMTHSMNLIIPTLKSRCVIFDMEDYSREELSKFTSDSLLMEFCDTPGQLIAFETVNVNGLLTEINNIFDSIKKCGLPVIFQLSSRVGFSDKDKGKISYKYFTNALKYVIISKVKTNPSQDNFKAYSLTQKFCNDCLLSCDKKRLYEKYLLELKSI